jgi:glucose/arabinose dehydrogenase
MSRTLRLRLTVAAIIVCLPLNLYGGDPLPDPIPESIEYGKLELRLTEIADGMVSPLHGTFAPGFRNKLFVADQVGIVYAINLTSGEKTVFLDIRDRIAINLGRYDERGLLGLAFHPWFLWNGLFYTYSSEATDGTADFPWTGGGFGGHQSVINEWRVNNPLNSGEVADITSRREVVRIDQPSSFHNGGSLAFDRHGLLYIALGNGGPLDTGQDNSNLLGSILRIIPNRDFAPQGNHSLSANGQYLIPESNPFTTDPDSLDEIFASGFRNPYSISTDRRTGEVYAGDVGNNDIEEINLVTAGSNYGFPIKEGNFCFVGSGGQPDGSRGVTDPADCVAESVGFADSIAEYDHDEGVAVIGGYVYRGKKSNRCLRSLYVFGDFNGRIFYLDKKIIREFRLRGQDSLGSALLGMGEDARGELYLLTNSSGVTAGTTGKLIRIDQSTYRGWKRTLRDPNAWSRKNRWRNKLFCGPNT